MGEPLVVIGNGMAAAHFVDALTRAALGRFAIAVVGEERQLAYNRVLLSSVLAGDVARNEIELHPARWWADRGVTLLTGHRAVAIDTAIRRVRLAGGATLPYRHVVLATGSRPARPAIPGIDRPGVLTFRDMADIEALSVGPGSKVVVIGGGLLGLEAAYGLAKAGAQVALVHLMDRLMERQLDARAAAMLRDAVEAIGVDVLLQAQTARIEGRRRANAVVLADGRVLEADKVVVATGISPNVDLAYATGLSVGRGIVVDDHMCTSHVGISAIGECAEHRGVCYGLVEPAYEQARVLARRLAGHNASYAGSILSTNLKVSGVHVFSAGDFVGAPGTESIVYSDAGLKHYKKFVIAEGRLVGAVLFGDTGDARWYLDLIRNGTPIEAFRDDLAFGRALAERVAA
ncbi:MAG: NAD(P)/FAD-dependent oxidoreductase [Pseudolabrys sp.]